MHLQDPDKLAIDDAYRGISKWSYLTLAVKEKNLEDTLKNLETTGFVAITIAPFPPNAGIRKIKAYKGKHGACYEKGQKAVYSGAAAAALDDDHHLLLNSEPLPVCEKTDQVLSLPPYEHLIRIIPPEKELSPEQPEYFSYYSIEEDQDRLLKRVGDIPEKVERISLFYPGPFKMLILLDGTMVRRGRITHIPTSVSKTLIKNDRLFQVDDQPAEGNEFYQDVFQRVGSKWMYDDFVVGKKSDQAVNTDFARLSTISVKMKKRLSQMVDKRKSYFLLTGSDPSDHLGCCPSDDVAEANQLVRAGILESCSQADHVNSCPVTFYAFKGEIKPEREEIEFMINPEFREQVLQILVQKPQPDINNTIKWFLLAFVIISVLFGIYKIVMNPVLVQDKTFFERLASADRDQTLVLLFHYHKRCYQCLNMEKYTRDILEEDFENEMKDKRVVFKLIDMDLHENRQTVKEFGFISPMIVMVDLENGKEKKIKVVWEAWKLFDDEPSFKALIQRELDQFISEKNE
jgi:hypothetical protein